MKFTNDFTTIDSEAHVAISQEIIASLGATPVIICRQSNHPEDNYLYLYIAKRNDGYITGLANTSSNKFQCAAKLCSLILKRRGIVKLITTYIDVIPDLVKHLLYSLLQS